MEKNFSKSSSQKKAIAIEYNPQEPAPKVTARGRGLVAERIVQKALDADVKTHKDAALVDELLGIDINCHIPPELYDAIAQILVFISELDREYLQKNQPN